MKTMALGLVAVAAATGAFVLWLRRNRGKHYLLSHHTHNRVVMEDAAAAANSNDAFRQHGRWWGSR